VSSFDNASFCDFSAFCTETKQHSRETNRVVYYHIRGPRCRRGRRGNPRRERIARDLG
jgi:hypothetical protein